MPPVTGVFGSDVWGADAWALSVWAGVPSTPSTPGDDVWGANVWGPNVWGTNVWSGSSATPAPSSVVTSGKYKADHDAALADIIAAGASPSTFARWSSSSASSIAGAAMQVKSDPERYAAKGLVLSTMLTLLFCPTVYGLLAYTSAFVMPGDTVVWNGVTLTAKDVETVAPDGVVIISRIVVG